MLPFRFHPDAEAEAEAAAAWYEMSQSGLGEDFLSELERALLLLSESPLTWPTWPGIRESLGIRRFLLSRFPYGLAYDTSGNEILVYAVAHLARRPGYWMERLKL